MDVWRILIYIVAAVLALRSLVALMTIHRHNYRQDVLAEEKRLARELRRKQAREKALEQAAAQAQPAALTQPEAIKQALAAAGSKRQ